MFLLRKHPQYTHDMFNLDPKFKPKMAKLFGDAGQITEDGLKMYAHEVSTHPFPQPENWFGVKDEEYAERFKLPD